MRIRNPSSTSVGDFGLANACAAGSSNRPGLTPAGSPERLGGGTNGSAGATGEVSASLATVESGALSEESAFVAPKI
jgi:hypothetical protein